MSAKVIRLFPQSDCEIRMYYHCKRCLEELPIGTSPVEYQRIEAGATDKGFQVRCLRHDINILHIDFEGHTHPAC